MKKREEEIKKFCKRSSREGTFGAFTFEYKSLTKNHQFQNGRINTTAQIK